MKINKPKNSKVSLLNYDIMYEQDPINEEFRCFGYCDNEKTTIVIDVDLDDDKTKFWLMHEIMEQINFVYSMNLTHEQIGALGVYFMEYIHNNPNVINYLKEK